MNRLALALIWVGALLALSISLSFSPELLQTTKNVVPLLFWNRLVTNDAAVVTGAVPESRRRQLEELDTIHNNVDLGNSLADSGASIRIFGPSVEGDVESYQLNQEVATAWFTPSQQRQFLQQQGRNCWTETTEDVLKQSSGSENTPVQRYDELAGSPFLQVELWKFCVFATGMGNTFWDRGQVVPLLLWEDLWASQDDESLGNNKGKANKDRSTALLMNHHNSDDTAAWIHSSFMRLDGKYARSLSQKMLQLLMETEEHVLTANPLYAYRALAQLIQNDILPYLWQAKCELPSTQHPADKVLVQPPMHNPKTKNKAKQISRKRRSRNLEQFVIPPEFSRLPTFGLHCTIPGGFCCQVWNTLVDKDTPVLLVKHPFGTTGGLTKKYSATTITEKQVYPANPVAYWSSITSVPNKNSVKPSKMETPNFFDILLQNNCLPTSQECRSCLKKPTSSTGCDEQCAEDCPCYCKVLCQIRPPPKHVQAVWYVSPPLYQEQTTYPQRLIPRIIHQTWYEPLDKDKYPNMSRLMSSWKHSGWKHHFYDDATAAKFLEENFPPQVLEAYNAIQPGAFKADLFR
jgi:hypothetical protein